MKYSIVAETPEELDVTAVDENGDFVIGDDAIQTLNDIGAIWPASPAISSLIVGGRKIVYLLVFIGSTDPKFSLDAVIELNGLDWQILMGQTFDKQLVGEGEEATYEALKIMEPDEARLFEFIPDRFLDEAQTIIDPNKHVNWVSLYSGNTKWRAAEV